MKSFTPLFIIMLLSFNASAQIISRFTRESNPVTTAVTGPNTISVSSYAVPAAGGANGSKRLSRVQAAMIFIYYWMVLTLMYLLWISLLVSGAKSRRLSFFIVAAISILE